MKEGLKIMNLLRLKQKLWVGVAVLIFAFVCISATSAQEATTDDPVTQIDTMLTRLAENRTFSGAALVARGDEILLNEGYGMANIEWEVPNTPDSKFRIGSITKQFTAMAILLLQEQGRLSVQNPICDYVEDCPAAWADITLLHLLNHTSGIRELFSIQEFTDNLMRPASPAQLIAFFRDEPLDFEPGTSWNYSNSGYVLLGHVIDEVSGQTYQRFLQENLFEPLGLEDTGYVYNHRIIPRQATGYMNSTQAADYVDMTLAYSAGGLYSTTGDLYRWARALFNGEVISPEGLQTALEAGADLPGATTGEYAAGLFMDELVGHRVIGHDGRIQGFVTFLSYFPEDDVTLIVLSNFENTPISEITENAARILFGES
jgi:CubicO group peptidase (beta-lactamase class C family)